MPEVKEWKVGVAYERYGYIKVSREEAKTEEEAVKVAEKKLEEMSVSELEEITEFLEGTEKIDPEGVLQV